MTPRDYQIGAIRNALTLWRAGRRRLVGRAATGAGKTHTVLWLLEAHMKAGDRALFIVDNRDLVFQAVEACAKHPRLGSIGSIHGSQKLYRRRVTVATVQSLSNIRLLEELYRGGKITHIIHDECHTSLSERNMGVIKELRERSPGAYELAVTATPFRADERGMATLFDAVAFDIPFDYLVSRKFLTKPVAIGLASEKSIYRYSDWLEWVFAAWAHYASRRVSLAYTQTTEQARRLAEFFRAAGVPAEFVSKDTPDAERERIKTDLGVGRLAVVFNAYLWTTGIDIPRVDAIILLRPATSRIVLEQCVGRGARLYPGKKNFLILDFFPTEDRYIGGDGDILGKPLDFIELNELSELPMTRDQYDELVEYAFLGFDDMYVYDIQTGERLSDLEAFAADAIAKIGTLHGV